MKDIDKLRSNDSFKEFGFKIKHFRTFVHKMAMGDPTTCIY